MLSEARGGFLIQGADLNSDSGVPPGKNPREVRGKFNDELGLCALTCYKTNSALMVIRGGLFSLAEGSWFLFRGLI